MKRSDIEILLLFNEKADRLLRSGFVKQMHSEGFGVNVSVRDGESFTSSRAPTEDELLSLANTVRFFVQDNEPTSVRNMADLYERLDIDEDFKRRFRESRTNLNSLLDDPSPLQDGVAPVSYRRLFLTVLYGDLVHSTKDKETEFQRWTRADPMKSLVMLLFFTAATNIVGFVEWCASLNRDVLSSLPDQDQAAAF